MFTGDTFLEPINLTAGHWKELASKMSISVPPWKSRPVLKAELKSRPVSSAKSPFSALTICLSCNLKKNLWRTYFGVQGKCSVIVIHFRQIVKEVLATKNILNVELVQIETEIWELVESWRYRFYGSEKSTNFLLANANYPFSDNLQFFACINLFRRKGRTVFLDYFFNLTRLALPSFSSQTFGAFVSLTQIRVDECETFPRLEHITCTL